MSESRDLIVVTGAGSGIGRAILRRLTGAGQRVLAVDVNLENAQAAAEDAGELATAGYVDVADEDSVRAMFAQADATAPLAGLVNAAGIGSTTTTPDTTI